MPHIIVETSPNLTLKSPKVLLLSINKAVYATGYFTPITAIKTRLYQAPYTCIGDDADEDEAFISVTMLLLPGRDDTVKTHVGKTIINTIQQHLVGVEHYQTIQGKLQITANLLDSDTNYQKTIV